MFGSKHNKMISFENIENENNEGLSQNPKESRCFFAWT